MHTLNTVLTDLISPVHTIRRSQIVVLLKLPSFTLRANNSVPYRFLFHSALPCLVSQCLSVSCFTMPFRVLFHSASPCLILQCLSVLWVRNLRKGLSLWIGRVENVWGDLKKTWPLYRASSNNNISKSDHCTYTVSLNVISPFNIRFTAIRRK